ncbi:MAG: hypothetical protein ACREXW_05115 [Gammaproteobacteria bacterium]
MSNADCLENLRGKVTLHVGQQLGQLDDEIQSITNRNASKGMLQSGATIKEVMRACSEQMEARVSFMTTAVQQLPLDYTEDLRDSLRSLIHYYLPQDLGYISERLDKIVRLAGDEKLVDRVTDDVKANREVAIKRLENEIDQYLIRLKKAAKLSTMDKVMFFVEAVALLGTVFLAGRWSVDPSGNYEPYIVTLGVLVPLLEVARRGWKRFAT